MYIANIYIYVIVYIYIENTSRNSCKIGNYIYFQIRLLVIPRTQSFKHGPRPEVALHSAW